MLHQQQGVKVAKGNLPATLISCSGFATACGRVEHSTARRCSRRQRMRSSGYGKETSRHITSNYLARITALSRLQIA